MFDVIGGFIKNAKKKVLALKVGPDKNPKVPDVIERLDEAEAAADKLAKLLSKLGKEDYEKALLYFNGILGSKFSADDVKEGAEALVALPVALQAVRSGLDAIEMELQS